MSEPLYFGMSPTRRKFLHMTGAALAAGLMHDVSAITLAPPDKEPPHLPIPGPPGKKLGYALVGIGELCLTQVLPAFAEAANSKVVALVSGHPEKAKKVANHYRIDEKNIYNYDNYENMRDNSEIDVVYVILPNSMHAEYTIRALKIGKHVLCEKPMATSSAECQQMIDAAKAANKKLMIAYRLHYEPYNMACIELAKKKKFGKINFIEAENLQDVQAPNIRLSKDLGGGALGDVGIYCINAARYLTGEEPTSVRGVLYSDPHNPKFAEVEEVASALLTFPSGTIASCTGAFGSAESRRFRATCEKGLFELEQAFYYSGQRMKQTAKDGSIEEPVLPYINQFAAEMDHLSQCIMNDKTPRTPGEEGLADLRVMEAVKQSAREQRVVQLS